MPCRNKRVRHAAQPEDAQHLPGHIKVQVFFNGYFFHPPTAKSKSHDAQGDVDQKNTRPACMVHQKTAQQRVDDQADGAECGPAALQPLPVIWHHQMREK